MIGRRNVARAVSALALTTLFTLGASGSASAQVAPVAPTRHRLEVAGTFPPALWPAGTTTGLITIHFNEPVLRQSITHASVRVVGRWTGTQRGTFAFGNGDRRVTLTPSHPFVNGETVFVNLANTIVAADATPMRHGGYAYRFTIRSLPSGLSFSQLDVMSNTGGGGQTRIHGAATPDLDNDGFLDLVTVNGVSADVRTALNLADGSGLYAGFLPPVPIGAEASRSATADFDDDGNVDLCVAATASDSVWILLGDGAGSFGSAQEVAVGAEPQGVAVLDADGDADMDVVVASHASGDLSLALNDGAGVFGPASAFDGGVNGEYGLDAGDMDRDGITDLVVAGRDGQELRVLLGDGNGAFTPAGPAQSSGGSTWVVVLDDVNGDRILDAATANSTNDSAAILLGDGLGGLGAPAVISVGGSAVSVALGDLDGDFDPDLVISSYAGGFWQLLRNNGNGVFLFQQNFVAPGNPSCAVLFDDDNDGDLDMALTDETADVVVLMENQ